METEILVNIAITGVCLFLMGIYFNYRETKIQQIADKKFGEIKEKYLSQIAAKKAKEKQEINRLKKVVEALEKQHIQFLQAQGGSVANGKIMSEEALVILKKAQERAKKIEEEVKTEAKNFLEDQKREVQIKMVDLVMGVTKRVMAKSLTYEEHKKMIEDALKEVESEAPDGKGN